MMTAMKMFGRNREASLTIFRLRSHYPFLGIGPDQANPIMVVAMIMTMMMVVMVTMVLMMMMMMVIIMAKSIDDDDDDNDKWRPWD